MMFCLSNLSVYGQQLIYNFGFLTNPVVGSSNFCEDGILTLDESHKDFIKGLSVANPEINCWSEYQLAFMAQFFLIGFAFKILVSVFPENYGYVRVMKVAVIPINIIGF